MKIENTVLKISRVEIIKRVFNNRGNVTHEEIQYFYPEEAEEKIVGFKTKKKKT